MANFLVKERSRPWRKFLTCESSRRANLQVAGPLTLSKPFHFFFEGKLKTCPTEKNEKQASFGHSFVIRH